MYEGKRIFAAATVVRYRDKSEDQGSSGFATSNAKHWKH